MRRFTCVVWFVAITLSAGLAAAQDARPRIAVFSGPTATIENSEPLVTSNKARARHGLPLRTSADGSKPRFDALRPQRLAAPVTVYVEAFSAHPLERDAAVLYAPPDGYIDPGTGAFSATPAGPDAVPVYEVELRPEDGLYPLPYMALQANGSPWEGHCTESGASKPECRVSFYPDASRIFEEIDRLGLGRGGTGNLLGSRARFDFYRAAPSGGYRNGLPAGQRTDVGDGDIPAEVWGRDFFPYTPITASPGMPTLARVTNAVQRALLDADYAGAIWLEGSPATEETAYWLGLLIDTRVPIVGLASQRTHGMLSNDGDRNIVDAVDYILSGVWRGADGADRIGAVMVQDEQIFTARDVQKGDDRPGGYLATGGHGGIVGGVNPVALSFVPTKQHTHASEVRLSQLPDRVPGVSRAGQIDVDVKSPDGELLESAMPKVTVIKHVRYLPDDLSGDADMVVEVLGRIEKNLADSPLGGFVLEGMAPYATADAPTVAALRRAALSGMPVARVGRGPHEAFTPVNERDLFIEGSNLTASKARMLLMACLLRFGTLPLPADRDDPTTAELDAIRAKVARYQAVFDSH
jgi:hypothetical protein